MKKLIAILLAVLMALASVGCTTDTNTGTEEPTTEPTTEPTSEPTMEIPEKAVLTEVLRCSIGDGNEQLGIDMSAEGNVPEAFLVFDDSIAILDSVKQRVCVYENGVLSRTIDISQANIYGYSMAKLNNSLFIYAVNLDMVFEFDYSSGEIINELPVPEEFCGNDSCDLFAMDGSIYIGARLSESYTLKNLLDPDASEIIWAEEKLENGKWVCYTPFASDGIRPEKDDNRLYYFINNDANGNAYFLVLDIIPNTENHVWYDSYLMRCSPDGETTGYAGFQNEPEIKIPHRHALVLEDGRVFEMMCTDTEVIIYEVTFGRTYEGRADELREYYTNRLEQGIIETAWAFAELVERVHEQQFDKEGAEVKINTYYANVGFPSALYPEEMLYITLEPDEDGNYEVLPENCYIDRAEGASIDAADARFGDDDVIGKKSEELHNAQIVVTVDDVRAFGCEAEIGSSEYEAAVAEVYGEKLAEYYRESFTEDSLFYCFDIRSIHAWADKNTAGPLSIYYVSIAFRVRDIRPFSYLFSYTPCFECGFYPEYEGWLLGWTRLDLSELQEDGSFVCNAFLNGAG